MFHGDSIENALTGRSNNFDVLRLFAALLLLWGHSYPLTGRGEDDIFSKALFAYDLSGSFAVTISFVISGFLVTRSASTRSISGYLAARALRILPALAIVVLATVFFIGPLLTRMTLKDSFSDPSTRSYLSNAFIILQHNLADTTQNLLHPGTINGSLWTLRLQCVFYVILLGLVRSRLFGKQIGLLITATVVAAFFYCVYHLKYGWNNEGPIFWQGIGVYSALKFGSAFMLGGALWIYRRDIPLSPWSALLCGLALISGAGSPASTVLYVLCVPYLVIYLALGLPVSLPLSEKIGDLSYGVYLMAFPVQQAVITFVGAHSPTLVSIIATAIVLPLAAVSWRFIEKPSLDFKTTGLPISSAALEHSALPVSQRQRNIARIVFIGHFIAGSLSRVKSASASARRSLKAGFMGLRSSA